MKQHDGHFRGHVLLLLKDVAFKKGVARCLPETAYPCTNLLPARLYTITEYIIAQVILVLVV